jgi:hypothetical protein
MHDRVLAISQSFMDFLTVIRQPHKELVGMPRRGARVDMLEGEMLKPELETFARFHSMIWLVSADLAENCPLQRRVA